MTDTTRKIGGLAPRATAGNALSLGRLIRENREAAPTAPSAPAVDAPVVDEAPAHAPAADESAAMKGDHRRPKSPSKRSAAADTGKGTVTFYMPNADRARARATFKATAHLEGDESFSDFITKAVNAEVERRELEHDGPFAGGDTRLPTGRPMRS